MTYTLLVSVLVVVSGAVASLHALLTKRDARAAFGWIAFCLILPLFGPLIYLVFGINRIKVKAQKLYSGSLDVDATHSVHDPEGVNLRPLSLVGEKVTGKGLRSCDSVELLENGEQLYPAMREAIANATEKVFLSSYLIDNDSVGREFVGLLAAAQERGVDVRVIIDGLGEYMTLPRIGGKLRHHNINFARFNPITVIPPALHINMRNHRKILMVDSRVAFTGGQNIGSRHLAKDEENGQRVVDLHFQFTGKIVDELERAFLLDWYYCKTRERSTPYQPRNENLNSSAIWSRLVLDGPNEYLDRLNDLIVGVISTAKSRVWIMTPYFLPGSDIVAALVGARLRGVDVKILLPAKNNIFLVHWATQNNLPYFCEKDIAIYFQPAPFVHTKALLVDDHYALVGSANMDSRSLRLNFELGVELFSGAVNRQLTDYFVPRIAAATRVTPERLKSVSPAIRVRNALAWLFSPYL